MSNSNLKTALFILRLGITIFFAVWALEKFIKPETTVAIWEAFYHVDALPLQASYAIGALQAAVVLCFFFGILKFWSYGLLMLMHAGSTVSSYEQLFNPYTGSNHLFVAAIPVLGALIALFLMRSDDTLLTLPAKTG
ncbi:MAG: hypothetical protein AAF936_00930 [Pseudomonadota bacterium]